MPAPGQSGNLGGKNGISQVGSGCSDIGSAAVAKRGGLWNRIAGAGLLVLIVGGLTVVRLMAQQPAPVPAAGNAPHFVVVDVTLDSGTEPLAAYQIEIVATNQATKIVGIEGGDSAAFRPPPYYDPAAMQGGRVVLGAFSLAAANELPRGVVRVASLHCLIPAGTTEPGFQGTVSAAATTGGRSVFLRVSLNKKLAP